MMKQTCWYTSQILRSSCVPRLSQVGHNINEIMRLCLQFEPIQNSLLLLIMLERWSQLLFVWAQVQAKHCVSKYVVQKQTIIAHYWRNWCNLRQILWDMNQSFLSKRKAIVLKAVRWPKAFYPCLSTYSGQNPKALGVNGWGRGCGYRRSVTLGTP
jgi:hypothetical protein